MKKHEVGDVVASSPWVSTSPSYEERIVLRLFKPREYAVHRESRNITSGFSYYFWGHYFSWAADGGEPEQHEALTKAWKCLADNEGTRFLLDYKP